MLGVAGASTRPNPSRSVLRAPLAPEFAQSIAGEATERWKFPCEGDTHCGLLSLPCDSWPVALTNAARVAYELVPQTICV